MKDTQILKAGQSIRYWCCQDENQKQQCRSSENEHAKHRDTVGMHRYGCQSKLTISCRTNPSREDTYTITISLEHHMRHTPYYDVSLHPEAAALIRENLDWFSPHEVSKKVMAIYPSITANQVHAAWTTMSETLWKRDKEQLPSVKLLLGECYETSIFISFLDYWQLLIDDTSTIYDTDVAIRVTMTLY